MKLARHDYDVDCNVTETSSFTIAQSAAVFDAIAGVYSNPIEAAVRELCTNAYETRTKFRVALPNALEPHFVVQDEGTGMPHDFMMGGYCVAGFSTKSNDEGTEGGFGWGRLAPLAVTGEDDKYIVVTQGRVYEVFRAANGVPTVAYMGSKPTNDLGTQIRVPVRRDDFEKYREAVQKVLQWFPPDTHEVFGTSVAYPEIHLETDYYIQLAEASYKSQVLVGVIAYDVDWRQVGHAPLPLSLVPKFQIKDIDLPPSREQVKYSPKTVASLKAAYTRIVEDLPPRTLQVAETLSPIDRLKLRENLYETPGMAALFEAYHKAQGHRAEDEAGRKEHRERTGSMVGHIQKWGTFLLYAHERAQVTKGGYTRYDKASYRSRSRGGGFVSNQSSSYSEPLEFYRASEFQSTAFFLRDKPDLKRIGDRILESGLNQFERWVVIDEPPIVDVPHLYKLSDYEPPAVARKASVMRHYVKSSGASGFNETTGALPSHGVWVPFEKSGPDDTNRWWRLLQAPHAREAKVYGLHKTAQKKADLPSLQRLDLYLKEQVAPWIDHVSDAIAARKYLGGLTHPIKGFMATDHAALLPAAWEAYQAHLEVCNAIPVEVIITIGLLEECKLVQVKPSKKKFTLHKVFERAAAKNRALMLMLEHGDVNWSRVPVDQIKEIIR